MEDHHLDWIFPLRIVIFHSYVSHYQRVLSNVHNELRVAGLAAEVGVFKLRDHHGQAAAERYRGVFTSGRCENQGLTRLNKKRRFFK